MDIPNNYILNTVDYSLISSYNLSSIFNTDDGKVTHGHGKGSGIPGPLPYSDRKDVIRDINKHKSEGLPVDQLHKLDSHLANSSLQYVKKIAKDTGHEDVPSLFKSLKTHTATPTKKDIEQTKTDRPTDSEIKSIKLTGLGNKEGNSELLQGKIGDKHYVFKASQMGKEGAEREVEISDLARDVGFNVPKTYKISKPTVPHDSEIARFKPHNDSWVIMDKVDGKPIENKDIRKPDIAKHMAVDAMFGYAIGHGDRNTANSIVDKSGNS